MSIAVVYKSSHPNVLQAVKDYGDQHRRFVSDAKSFASEAGKGWEPLLLRGFCAYMAGLLPRGKETPNGAWRLTRVSQYGVWVPDKRYKSGKEVANRMASLRLRPLYEALPGIPTTVDVDNKWYHPGVHSDSTPTVVWVYWGVVPLPEYTGFSNVREVDLSLWEKAKLSEYYLMVEQ